MDNEKIETAIQNEQQFKTSQEIINDIIKIFADNALSITDAEGILASTAKELYKQPIIIIDENVKRIYRMRNTGEIHGSSFYDVN